MPMPLFVRQSAATCRSEPYSFFNTSKGADYVRRPTVFERETSDGGLQLVLDVDASAKRSRVVELTLSRAMLLKSAGVPDEAADPEATIRRLLADMPSGDRAFLLLSLLREGV